MRLFVANVGVNTSDASRRGLRSPIFPDGTFEFVPIKERVEVAKYPGIPTYQSLKCWTGRAKNLAAFIPARYSHYGVHADPEFDTFTYGDVLSPRAANLKKITQGDQLWFLGRLWGNDGKQWTGESNFYFIGLIEVEQNILISAGTTPQMITPDIRQRMEANAHYRRLVFANDFSTFRVIIGHPDKSFRFQRALLVNPAIVGHIYAGTYDPGTDTYKNGAKTLENKNGKPRRYCTFGSVTRSVQAHLDSTILDHQKHIIALTSLAQKCAV